MKNLLFYLALCAPWWGWGQKVNGLDFSTLTDIDYIELQGMDMAKMDIKKPSEYRPKIVVAVDYGQEITPTSDNVVRDMAGNQMFFSSMMGAVNVFSKWGWEYVSNYSVSGGGGQVYHYVMRRRK